MARPLLGPSAFSYYLNRRFQNISNLSKYHKLLLNNESPVDFEEELEPLSRLRELLAINLRLTQGVDLNVFKQTHEVLDDETKAVLAALEKDELIIKNDSQIKLTKRGTLFYDTVASEIV